MRVEHGTGTDYPIQTLQDYYTRKQYVDTFYTYDNRWLGWVSPILSSDLDIANISKARMDTGSTNLMTLVYTLPGGLVYELRATESQIQLWKKPVNGNYQQLWAK